MKSNIKYYTMLTTAMFIFGTIGVFRKYIPLGSGTISCARGFLGSLVILLFSIIKGGNFNNKISLKNIILLMVSGAVIGGNWIFLFEAYNYTTISVATLCYYMAPTIIMLVSPIFFKEKLTTKKIICVLFSLLGMTLVSGINDIENLNIVDLIGVLLGLIAAIFYAILIVLNKKNTEENSYIRAIVQLFTGATVLIPYVLIKEKPDFSAMTPMSITFVLILGIVHTGVAYILYFASIRHLKAQSIAILSYMDPVSAILFSWLILNEQLSYFGIIGAVLIIGTAVIFETNLFKLKENV